MQRSTALRLLLLSGCVLTASPNGSNATDLGARIRVLQWEKRRVWHSPKTLDSREENCSMLFLIHLPPNGSERFRQWTSYAKCGCKITSARMMWFAGDLLSTFPSARRMTKRLIRAAKRSTTWVGYKVHLTETCEAHLPLIITHVETTAAPVSDDAMTATIHAELERKDLLPTQHLVDTGYVDANLLVESERDYQIDLVGPTCKNYQWQATQQTGYDADHFLIDWQQQQATCPEGHTSSSWTPATDSRANEVIKIKFSTTDCQACPARSRCTQSVRHVRRTVTIRPNAQYFALKERREREMTKEFTQIYAKRAGIEGTISQGVRTMGLRRSRSIGQEKTHLQHIATAAVLNLVRCLAWERGVPRAV